MLLLDARLLRTSMGRSAREVAEGFVQRIGVGEFWGGFGGVLGWFWRGFGVVFVGFGELWCFQLLF